MLSSLLFRLLFAPALSLGPRWLWLSLVVPQVLAILASVAWLVAPMAIWQAFGAGWLWLWLVPTAVAVFTSAGQPSSGFG